MGFDFDAAVTAPFRMQPGLRRLAPGARQLTPARLGSRHLREKLAVLGRFAGQALVVQPGFDANPALAALYEHAAAEHPDFWSWDGARGQALRLGAAVAGVQVEPLEAPAGRRFGWQREVVACLQALAPEWRLPALFSLAFAEDFAIVDGEAAVIPWIAACLPSHWAPEEKVGRPFAEVHAPVADNRLIVGAAAHLSRLVCGPERWERFVWNVAPHPRLHAHPARVDPRRWELTPIESAWWRSERQSFIPVEGMRQAVFAIEVQVERLADALAAPGRAARLHDAVASMSPAVLNYRGLAPVRDALLAWLSKQAGGHSPPSW